MADLDHEHDEFAVLDIADDPVVANLVPPEMFEMRTLKRFAAPLLVFILGMTAPFSFSVRLRWQPTVALPVPIVRY